MFFGSLSEHQPAGMRLVTTHDAGYQLYWQRDKSWVGDQVQMVQEFGFDALCLTVDSAVYSLREQDMLHRFKKPWRKIFGSFVFYPLSETSFLGQSDWLTTEFIKEPIFFS